MKKLISMIMLIVMLFTLCACGETPSNSNVIYIKMSDEAKQKKAQMEANDTTKAILSEEYFDQVLVQLANRQEQKFPERTLENKLTSMECEGSKVYMLEKENYDKVILYIHGGAWAFPIGKDHVAYCDELVNTLNAKVYMPFYPLVPNANSEDGYTMIEALYKEILKEGKDVYLMGDSAGGNISLGLLYVIKQEGLAYPKKTVLISPCVDMSFSNEAMVELDKEDPMLAVYGCKKCAELWAGKENVKDPKNSALYADVTGYPDIMIIQGTCDILYPDVMSFYNKLKNAGVNTTLVLGEGLWHVFAIEAIPEAETCLNLVSDFCLK